MNSSTVFKIKNESEFEAKALEVFEFQYRENTVYREFCNYLGRNPKNVSQILLIPFLPIEFFKSKTVLTGHNPSQIAFSSSGTTGNQTSLHHVTDLGIYKQSYLKAFEHFYGDIQDYCILALLPSYLEREGSSLIYMVDDLIKKSGHHDSGFYLDEFDSLKNKLLQLEVSGNKVLLIGVSFALLDFAEKYSLELKNTIVMETGGMKGKRKEMIRSELHQTLKQGFGVDEIHSEYGMTELLSQAYSKGNGIFKTPRWMKVFIRDTEDPLTFQKNGKTGGINIIDLANINSCSFIATQDLGKKYADGSFAILGRFDHSDVRGCNLMVL
ncbi:acyl transferase [Maribacter algarum]|uniref:Acyl transferase n=1 Tax=Maribacter algarum (ex Zhang et al. 2020) TaxID=2578118 RepID=A0A5S3PXL3_9FLAO|nr:acyl transferase [Maribacter algarum]TMM59600.1 acyl transferase [Maribacter algarum]